MTSPIVSGGGLFPVADQVRPIESTDLYQQLQGDDRHSALAQIFFAAFGSIWKVVPMRDI